VGELTAGRIVAYWEEYGPFTRVEEIMDVPGIGEGRFEGFKEMITVGS
jgi:competence protein ComEA